MSTFNSSPRADGHHRASKSDASIGQLLSDLSTDLQKLFRQEVALARAEMRREAVKAGLAAGMLSVAGFAAYMVVVVGSFAAVFGLANLMDLAWAALIIVGVWAVLAGVLVMLGIRLLRRLSPTPVRTIETLKDGARWARSLTS